MKAFHSGGHASCADSVEFVDAAVCFDVSSGAVLASHAVAVDDPPWQSFRDFSVGPDGTLYALRRKRDEARLLAFACGTAPR